MHSALEAAGIIAGESFQLAAFNDGRIAVRTFVDVERAVAWITAQVGDRYLCLNPVSAGTRGKASLEDIARVACVLLDFDPRKTSDDPSGCAPAARRAAREAAIAARAVVGGALVDSGRGTQLWVRHSEGVDRARLVEGVRIRFAGPLVAIDATQNADRLARLPGFTNTRTGEVARILEPQTGILSADLAAGLYAAERAVDAPVAGIPLEIRGRALAIWNESGGTNRSARDARFLLELLRLSVADDRAWQLVLALPGGKAREDSRTDESYRVSTFKWARRIWDEDLAAIRLVRVCKKSRAVDDDVVTALIRVRDLSVARYHKAVKRLGGGDIPRVEIKKAVDTRRALTECSDVARHAVADGASAGWWYKGSTGWVCYSSGDWARIAQGLGLSPPVVAATLAALPWTMVAEPFQAEELPNRRWNRNAAALRCAPRAGPHAMWDQLLRVVGRGLNDLWPEGGANYLLLWIASVIQRPAIKLPYLFLYGEEQDSGKSSLHEALALLLERGYVLANEALTNDRGFNGELHGAVICAADEIKVTKRAYARIKNWCTGDRIQIHPKGKTAYQLDNRTHWIQTGNRADDCPQMRGDTRITAWEVWRADSVDQMDKIEMFRRLVEEAPAFTHTIKTVPLPAVCGRLGLPVLETASKTSQQASNATPLEAFLDLNYPKHLEWSDTELVSNFLESLTGQERGEWSAARVTGEMPGGHGRERRLIAFMRRGPWQGTIDALSPMVPGDWKTPEALRQALSKSWPGFIVTKTRTKTQRLIKIEPSGGDR